MSGSYFDCKCAKALKLYFSDTGKGRKMRYLALFFLLNCVFVVIFCASVPSSGSDGNGHALYLTPYIESGKLEEAKNLAKVESLMGNVESYSGLLTVDKEHGSNIFFWYFPAENKGKDVPLVTWNNGFSTASTSGVFLQNGPFDLLTDKMKMRKESWHKFYHMVYLDSPVGVGYSFTNTTKGYSTSMDHVALNLHKAIEQFLKLFPELSGRELYLATLSMGGKYIPALADRLIKEDSLNLKGIFVGNPFFDFMRQMTYENFLYQLGFIDKNQIPILVAEQNRIKSLASSDLDKFYEDNLKFWLNSDSFLVNITGLDNIWDYEDNVTPYTYYLNFITKDDAKNKLHVGGVAFDDGTKAMEMLASEVAGSSLHYLERLVDKLDMMFYAGQQDVSCNYPLMVECLMALNWTGKAEYSVAPRTRLYKEDGTHVWGYMRNYKTLSDVMVRKAGHSAVTSQPNHVLSLLKQFTNYKRFE